MNSETKAWLFSQIKGLILLTTISLTLAIGTNMLRKDPISWVEERRLLRAGDRFPYIPVSTAAIPEYRKYLGLSPGKEMVTIVDVKAELLVVEVLNLFCFPCQTQILSLNKVHQMIEERPDLKSRIKIVGVALGNTKKVLDGFVEDYKLAFPIIPDPDARSENIIGPGIHTPFSLFIRQDDSGRLGLVAGTHDGAVDDPDLLFDGLVALLKMKPGSAIAKDLFHKKT